MVGLTNGKVCGGHHTNERPCACCGGFRYRGIYIGGSEEGMVSNVVVNQQNIFQPHMTDAAYIA